MTGCASQGEYGLHRAGCRVSQPTTGTHDMDTAPLARRLRAPTGSLARAGAALIAFLLSPAAALADEERTASASTTTPPPPAVTADSAVDPRAAGHEPGARQPPRVASAARREGAVVIDGLLDERGLARGQRAERLLAARAGRGRPLALRHRVPRAVRRRRALRRRARLRSRAGAHPRTAHAPRRRVVVRLDLGEDRLVPRSPHRLRLLDQPGRRAARRAALQRRRVRPQLGRGVGGEARTSMARAGRPSCASRTGSCASPARSSRTGVYKYCAASTATRSSAPGRRGPRT